MSRSLLSDRPRLILLSFLMLFVELALIRWTGSNVIYLSYFSNFVLLGSFLGIGLGFLRGERRPDLWPFAPVALGGLIAVVRFFPVEINSAGGEFLYFGELRTSGPPRALVLTVIFLVVAAVMAFIAQGVARTFVKFPPLEAYRLDLIGSVLGIIGFSALAFLRAPPLAWGAVAVVVMLALEAPRWSWTGALQVGGGLTILIVLALETFSPGTSWSPYYKIETTPSKQIPGALLVNVNGLPHQAYFPAVGPNGETNPLYNLTYESIKGNKLDDVLVIGAGGGNDVSVALKRGAKHVDAVEIDPRLYDLGKSHHPDRPYSDKRVTHHIGDGRAFLESTDKKYDLIVFALPDSLTLVSGNSALRLESYIFTKEAFEAARDRLKPNGVFSLYNYYREGWLIDRYAGTASQVFGHDPCVIGLGPKVDLAVLVVGRKQASANCGANGKWVPTGKVAAPATDDHPFAYLRTRSIPTLYSGSMALILAVSIGLILLALYPWKRGVRREVGSMFRFTDLFFMGAAFLLLETKSVVQFALLFGTTWFVNALVFLGVLLSVLLAVAVSKRVTFKHPARLYLLLLASLVLAWVVAPSSLLTLALVPRFFVASTLAFLPIFFANLIFTQRFKSVAASTTAFGANLLGAMVGGILEYTALITGYRALLILVALLYGLALLFGRRHLTHEPTEDDEEGAELLAGAAEPLPASP
ncbi:MAG: spermidine synthase [Acidimicrobiia bacterium]